MGSEMPTASITMPGGATIVIEGTQAEVADLVAKFQATEAQPSKSTARSLRGGTSSRTGPFELIVGLIEKGLFKTPRELGAVRIALEEQGHFYPVTTLSPVMLRLVRRKFLRRIKTNKRWTYVS
jgi:hypothetical protein